MKYVDEKIEKLNPQSIDRNRLHSKTQIQIIANIKTIAMLEHGRLYREIDRIFNTQLLEEVSKNFDELIEAGIKTLSPQYSFNVVSSIQKDSISHIANNNFQNIIKLHGDYRYDSLQNTEQELQNLENQLSDLFYKNLIN